MASTNPSTTRLNRSPGDRSLAEIKPHERTPSTSSSRNATGKNILPQAKIQALEQFVKFGRKGKPKDKENQKAVDFPPSSWFGSDPTPTSPVAVDSSSGVNTAARPAPPHDSSSRLTPSRSAPQLPSRTDTSPRPLPDMSGTSRRRNAETGVDSTNALDTAATQSPPGTNKSPTLERRGASFPSPGTLDGEPEDESAPEPLTLARRIQTLLSLSTVPPTPSATDAATSSCAERSEVAGPATPGSSVPPASIPVTDSRFLALLGNANAMGGSLDKGRQSVFAILDRLRRPSARAMEAPADSAPSSVSEEQEGAENDDENSSIMLYGPLVPSEDSEVELAASDIMSVFDDGETFEFEQPARPLSFIAAGEQLTPRSPPAALPLPIPEDPTPQEVAANTGQHGAQREQDAPGWFGTLKEKMIEGGKLVSDKVVEGGKLVSEKVTEGTKSLKDKMPDGRKVVKTTTRWVPSPDKISFQATWWGYRLYLPPPVLEVLNNKRLQAAKRAAIITTALQWLLGHVPPTVVPPQFRAGLFIAQRLVPYLGYIGGFIAWSWGAMKSFDKGHGIVLTATWLLPVALIPGTWEANRSVDGLPQAETSLELTPAPRDATGAGSPSEASTSNSNRGRVR
ncbi:hypothetical protein BJV78DRAFT_1284875 [Lactifluus subvellereus]|nr:hypothetical protein BJV78DRAFT_1284875 [Lactifluus subvellereus]